MESVTEMPPGMSQEEYDKIRYRNLREKYNGLFKEFFVFPFISTEYIEDGLILQLLSTFKAANRNNKRPIDIIFNENVKYIGVNLQKRNKQLNGYLIFAY